MGGFVEVFIDAAVKSSDWQKVAAHKARAACKAAGVDWIDASVFVHLPEKGRCFIKKGGHEQLISFG